MGQPHERTLHGLEEVHGRRPSPRCGGQRLLGPQERADGGARGGLQHSVEGLLLRVEGHSGGACGTDQDALVRLFEFFSFYPLLSFEIDDDALGPYYGNCLGFF